jgi:hypothetical protein
MTCLALLIGLAVLYAFAVTAVLLFLKGACDE